MGRTAATRAALLARTCGAGARRADSQKGATRRAARAPLASTEAAPRVCARAPARASSPDRLAIAPHGFAGAPPACPDERARSCRRESATARSQGHARDLARAREADVGARDVGDRGGGGGAGGGEGAAVARAPRTRPPRAPAAARVFRGRCRGDDTMCSRSPLRRSASCVVRSGGLSWAEAARSCASGWNPSLPPHRVQPAVIPRQQPRGVSLAHGREARCWATFPGPQATARFAQHGERAPRRRGYELALTEPCCAVQELLSFSRNFSLSRTMVCTHRLSARRAPTPSSPPPPCVRCTAGLLANGTTANALIR